MCVCVCVCVCAVNRPGWEPLSKHCSVFTLAAVTEGRRAAATDSEEPRWWTRRIQRAVQVEGRWNCRLTHWCSCPAGLTFSSRCKAVITLVISHCLNKNCCRGTHTEAALESVSKLWHSFVCQYFYLLNLINTCCCHAAFMFWWLKDNFKVSIKTWHDVLSDQFYATNCKELKEKFTQKCKSTHHHHHHLLLPPCWWRLRWSLVVHRTFLELHSKTVLQRSAKQQK